MYLDPPYVPNPNPVPSSDENQELLVRVLTALNDSQHDWWNGVCPQDSAAYAAGEKLIQELRELIPEENE